MEKELTDERILAGLRNRDSKITREYFYGYCRIGYYIYNKRYGLSSKPGMDFFSLAHEYYLALDKHNWKQLEDRKPGASMKTWMINGFRFILLDKLKEVEKEHHVDSIEERLDRTQLRFDVADDNFQEDVRKTLSSICSCHLTRDSKDSIILNMFLVEGFKGKEIAAQLGMTPSAVSQRYTHLMTSLVIPYFKENFVAESSDAFVSNKLYDSGISYNISNMENNINYAERTTPINIEELGDNEIFVFGSNLQGMHGGGAARAARLHFGAVMGQGVGLQGQSYAIPTMQGGTDTIQPYVNDFIRFAEEHPDKTFFVTRIGCGIAGFDDDDIAPLFEDAINVKNIFLPKSFWDILV